MARESFMIVKSDSARAPSTSGEKFAAMAAAAFSTDEVEAPSDRVMASSKFSVFGGALCVWSCRPT